jgi:hypothetical protein
MKNIYLLALLGVLGLTCIITAICVILTHMPILPKVIALGCFGDLAFVITWGLIEVICDLSYKRRNLNKYGGEIIMFGKKSNSTKCPADCCQFNYCGLCINRDCTGQESIKYHCLNYREYQRRRQEGGFMPLSNRPFVSGAPIPDHEIPVPPIDPRALGHVVYLVNEIRHYRNGKLIDVFGRKR